ncbi:hypothetical protein SKAU_G00299580 [Synaphobranchus kaupii]|uniref:Uncharacterized protein n=1 Tax=Synaphobranchus kaupii TaxID=118154 RepID=A0A9Q1EVE6_SYNKA|nr:hypothetical protein SKAU_G00299580 [Synaphobranchus kaupii]
MIDHLTLLNNVRLDHHFRMTFLFRGATLRFIGLFSQRSSRMRQFLEALEEGAVQLDRMKMGASISSVAGSTVGFAGGIISIVGLALAPVTAGVSLTLTLVGVGLGATSGVNGLATGIAEMSVNSHHGKKVNRILQRYKEDVATVLAFLEQAARRSEPDLSPNMVDTVVGAGKMGFKIFGVSRKIDTIVDGASLALSKSARSGFIALNSIFMGLDVFFICKDSISLAKGSKSDVSKVIRGRASLWKTELDAWERIHHSLCIGIWRFRKSMEVLERPFYS